MNNEQLMLIPMRQEHVPAVVEVHIQSFPGFFLTFLGPRFLSLLYAEILRFPGHVALIATNLDDQRVLGFVVGVTNQIGLYRHLLFRHWFHFGIVSVHAICSNPKTVFHLTSALACPKRSETAACPALLMSIAVLPDHAGYGIGQVLVRGFLENMKKADIRQVSLTTDQDNNDRANRFYQLLGFKLVRTYRTKEKRNMNEYMIYL